MRKPRDFDAELKALGDKARELKLKLDTTNLELFDLKGESGKFRGAWHHAAGVRGGAAVALMPRSVVA